MSISYTGSPLHTAYGKALFKHHQYTHDHSVKRLSGLSSDDMTNFPLLKIPGVVPFIPPTEPCHPALGKLLRQMTHRWLLVLTNTFINIIQRFHMTFLPTAPEKLLNPSPKLRKRRGSHRQDISPPLIHHRRTHGFKLPSLPNQRRFWNPMSAPLARLIPPVPTKTTLTKLQASSGPSRNPKLPTRKCVKPSLDHFKLRSHSKQVTHTSKPQYHRQFPPQTLSSRKSNLNWF